MSTLIRQCKAMTEETRQSVLIWGPAGSGKGWVTVQRFGPKGPIGWVDLETGNLLYHRDCDFTYDDTDWTPESVERAIHDMVKAGCVTIVIDNVTTLGAAIAAQYTNAKGFTNESAAARNIDLLCSRLTSLGVNLVLLQRATWRDGAWVVDGSLAWGHMMSTILHLWTETSQSSTGPITLYRKRVNKQRTKPGAQGAS